MRVAFLGLGAIGAPMAATLQAGGIDTAVWNRTAAKATAHAAAHGTVVLPNLDALVDAEVVCSCLPTHVEVAQVVAEAAQHLRPGTIWLDHTSADPDGAREVAATLGEHGVHYLDAPVSGGTDGAAEGRLTVMVGGDASKLDEVMDVVDVMAARVVPMGPVGAGMAVKAVNNALLAASLWAAGEGLVALKAAGVDPSAALEVINGASGRSFASEQLIGQRVLTREFPRTFALGLLAKDVGLAANLVDSVGQDAPAIAQADVRTRDAASRLGADADHVELVKLIEAAAELEL